MRERSPLEQAEIDDELASAGVPDECLPERRSTPLKGLIRHLAWHGVLALIVAVAYLALLRGLEVRMILVFGVPPTYAALFSSKRYTPGTRRVAWAFLAAVGVGALVAHFPSLFPKLRGFNGQLPPWQDRMLTWYVCIYFIWLAAVLPVHGFCGSLRAHRRGQPARFSRFTCYLGLSTAFLCCIALPRILIVLGFWPVF